MRGMSDRELQVPAGAAGERVDHWLAQALGISRGYARRLIERGCVRIGARPAPKGHRLGAGERVAIGAFRHPDQGPRPAPDLALRLLARDSDYLAFDKPAGLPSHALDFDDTHSAANAALAHEPGLAAVGPPLECGLVHRLDTLTSGVLVFARTPESLARARAALAAGDVDKHYVAHVHGRVEFEQHELELRVAGRGRRVRVVTNGGRRARSQVARLETSGTSSALAVQIHTGVRHQIRVGLAWLGHPVIGDRLYGSEAPLERHLLHASVFRLGSFAAQADLPAEMRELIQ